MYLFKKLSISISPENHKQIKFIIGKAKYVFIIPITICIILHFLSPLVVELIEN